MKLKLQKQIVIVSALSFLLTSYLAAQTSSEFWINVKDDVSTYDNWTLLFGNHVNATYGIDSLNPKLIEHECPSAFEKGIISYPPGFLVFWKNIPGRINIWGTGLWRFDFRGIPTNSYKVDTFKIYFGNAEYTNADFTLSWPNAEYLSQRCDSMFLVYPGNQFPRINAFTTDSVVIIDAGDRGISFFLIYKYGCNIIDAVQSEFSSIPTDFSLHQNYPNPFNPATTISFDLQRRLIVSLTVYDVLGQEVSRAIENQTIDAGVHEVEFDSRTLPSGVYFYRLTTHDTEPRQMISQAVKKMIILQ